MGDSVVKFQLSVDFAHLIFDGLEVFLALVGLHPVLPSLPLLDGVRLLELGLLQQYLYESIIITFDEFFPINMTHLYSVVWVSSLSWENWVHQFL